MRRRVLDITINEKKVYSKENAPAGAVYMIKMSNINQRIFVNHLFVEDYLLEYCPIGLVVIPASHDVYGNGQCAITYSHEASMYTETSGEEHTLYGSNIDEETAFVGISKFNYVNVQNYSTGKITSRQTSNLHPYTDYVYGYENRLQANDGVGGWMGYSGNDGEVLPSPYNLDGSRNENFSTTKYNTKNVLSHFDGLADTELIYKNSPNIGMTIDEGLIPWTWYYLNGNGRSVSNSVPRKCGLKLYIPSVAEMCYLYARYKLLRNIGTEISPICQTYAQDYYTDVWASYRNGNGYLNFIQGPEINALSFASTTLYNDSNIWYPYTNNFISIRRDVNTVNGYVHFVRV